MQKEIFAVFILQSHDTFIFFFFNLFVYLMLFFYQCFGINICLMDFSSPTSYFMILLLEIYFKMRMTLD